MILPRPPLTLGAIARTIGMNLNEPTPRWPPDAFAVAMSALRQGVYARVVNRWPPSGDAAKWVREIRKIGDSWRRRALRGESPPGQVVRSWKVLRSRRDLDVKSALDDEEALAACVQVIAAAD